MAAQLASRKVHQNQIGYVSFLTLTSEILGIIASLMRPSPATPLLATGSFANSVRLVLMPLTANHLPGNPVSMLDAQAFNTRPAEPVPLGRFTGIRLRVPGNEPQPTRAFRCGARHSAPRSCFPPHLIMTVAPIPTTWPRAPFDPTIATHPLLVVDFALVEAGDEAEIATLIRASTTLGFFYLKNHGVEPEPIFELGERAFKIPLEESLEYEMGDSGRTFGYKKVRRTFCCTPFKPEKQSMVLTCCLQAGGTNTDAAGNLEWVVATRTHRTTADSRHLAAWYNSGTSQRTISARTRWSRTVRTPPSSVRR